jgi:hypothetical protein
MRTKTAYREIQSDNSAENIPKELPVTVVSAPPEAPAVAVEPPVAASEALSRQLDELKRSEELVRQRMLARQSPEFIRSARLEEWKPNLSEIEFENLKRNPDWIDYPQITNLAATEALQMHERNSEPYFAAVRERFDAHMNKLRNAQPQPAQQSTPKFFQPPPPPKPPTRSNIVSAPVSREVPSGRPREENPNRTTLTAEELAVAAASGITATQYAAGKLRRLV